MAHAKTFSVVERDGFRIVDVRSTIADWGGSASGPTQHVRLVLIARGRKAPALVGDLAGAMIVSTPVSRVAVNSGPHEAVMTALGVEDRLVAVGGTFSYNDRIRARVDAKHLRQVGYGWHSPPELDVLLVSQPDVFLMSMANVSHADHLRRIQALGVPVLPTFFDAEPDYMGKLDYVRLIGMLTGREQEADLYVARVTAEVQRLKTLAATRPRVPMIWAWYARGDKWGALVRNAEAQLARDAGGYNLLERPDDANRDALRYVGTEELLQKTTAARCWIVRDDQSPPFRDRAVLERFAASQSRCLYGVTGRTKPKENAYDYYETVPIRPDLILADLIAMLHPELGVKGGGYIVPDRDTLAL